MGIKVGGSETFAVREGWIPKGLKIVINSNNNPFLGDDAVITFGVGTNMIKSIRYYLSISNMIKDYRSKVEVNSELGIDILIKKDPYFENDFSYYLFHYLMISNDKKQTVFSYLFNNFNKNSFTKTELIEDIIKYSNANNEDINTKVLEKDVGVLVSTYARENKIKDIENTYISPLVNLKLVKKIDKDTFEKINGNVEKVPDLLVFYAICKCMDGRDSISINELMNKENSPTKVFNLNKEQLYKFIDRLRRQKYLRYESTAGLNMVYIPNKITMREAIKEYYK